MQVITTDKLSMRNKYERQHMTQWSRQAVITASRSTWMTTKINGVATDLFCTGVIGHPRCTSKLGTEIPNLKRHDWSTKDLEILSLRVPLRMRKDYHPHDARSETIPIKTHVVF